MMRTLTPLLSLLIAVLLYFFFTQPAFTEVTELKGEIDEYEDATESYLEFSSLLEQKLSVKRNRSAAENERLERLLPDDVDETRILVDLEAMAESHNMLFGNVEVKTGEEAQFSVQEEGSEDEFVDEFERPAVRGFGLVSTEITFEVIGTYEQFKELLSDIEESLTLLEVTKITLNATEGSFQQFAVTIRTYALAGD